MSDDRPPRHPSLPPTGQFRPGEVHWLTYYGRLADVLAGLCRAADTAIPAHLLSYPRVQARYALGIPAEDAARELFEDFVKPTLGREPAPPLNLQALMRSFAEVNRPGKKPTEPA